MDDHVAAHLEIRGDRSKNAQLFFGKGVKEISDGIIGALRNGRIKIVDDDFGFHIDRFVGAEHQSSGGVNDPQGSRKVSIQCIKLVFHAFQSGFVVVKIGSIGVGNQRCFLI